MREIPSTITSKGQVTIPAEVRHHLALEKGDKVAFVIEEDGIVRLKAPRFPTVESVAGVAGSLPEPLTWEEMRTIARQDRFSAGLSNGGPTE